MLWLAAACAQAPVQVPVEVPLATAQNIEAAKASGMGPVMLGEFRLADTYQARVDSKDAKAASATPAALKQTLAADLRGAGLLATGTGTVIHGQLMRSDIAERTLAARFLVTHSGRVVYDKVQQADAASSATLQQRIVGMLLADPDFRKAVSP